MSEAIEERLLAIQKQLDHWNAYVRGIDVKTDSAIAGLIPALLTRRYNLINNAKPCDLKASDTKVLYDIIGCLLETNQVLQHHASGIAELADHMYENIKGLVSSTLRLRDFAEFKSPVEEIEHA